MMFVMEERPRVVHDNPTMMFADIGRELGKRWRTLDKDRKSIFTQRETINRQTYRSIDDESMVVPIPTIVQTVL